MTGQHKTSTTVAKAFAILDMLVSKGGNGLSLSEVSSHLQVSKSTAHRYLTTLEELEVVTRDERDHFALGPKLIELTGAFLSTYDLRTESDPSLNKLSAQTQETVHLAIPSGNAVVYVAKVDSPHSVRMASRLGTRNPLHCTALGKAILAHYPPDRVEEIIREGLSARTPHTLTTPEALRAELECVRAQGFATDDQENEIGVRCASAPIFDYTGKVIAAISVSGPASRVTRERSIELGPLVKEAAQQVSRRMGYQP
ncbi:MAG: IclR family transcriptional regulator [Anaerolineae bacterium]|nr:MAG: IclR family transcriptional regulator [Anaerolineae bacterium]